MLAFIHIPKTAGSSVNFTLEAQLGRGMSHIEALMNAADFVDIISNCNWISGHVPRVLLRPKLSVFQDVKYITFLRSPVEQLISHIKWQFAIFDKGHNFILTHPLKNQLIALEAMNVDYNSPSNVIDFLSRNKDMFLNFQSNYVLSDPSRALDAQIVQEECGFFSLIGTTFSAYSLLSKFLGAKLKGMSRGLLK